MVADSRQRRGGFTLIELMIVIAIIAVVVVIAIPNLLRARIQSNESATIQNMRAILSAQAAHHAAKNAYAAEMEELVNADPSFLEHDFLQEPLAGYVFLFAGDGETYTINANAMRWGRTGVRGFFSDASAVIRYKVGGPADAESPVL